MAMKFGLVSVFCAAAYLFLVEAAPMSGGSVIFQQGQFINAICNMQNGIVNGLIHIRQEKENSPVEFFGEIYGLSPGEHGIHVHQYGNLSNGCMATGEHFNPYVRYHGAPADFDRHAGDLGNIITCTDRVAAVVKSDFQMKLSGDPFYSIMGRSMVVHAQRDDLGRGNNKESKINGNSGDRLGCCVIEQR